MYPDGGPARVLLMGCDVHLCVRWGTEDVVGGGERKRVQAGSRAFSLSTWRGTLVPESGNPVGPNGGHLAVSC